MTEVKPVQTETKYGPIVLGTAGALAAGYGAGVLTKVASVAHETNKALESEHTEFLKKFPSEDVFVKEELKNATQYLRSEVQKYKKGGMNPSSFAYHFKETFKQAKNNAKEIYAQCAKEPVKVKTWELLKYLFTNIREEGVLKDFGKTTAKLGAIGAGIAGALYLGYKLLNNPTKEVAQG